MHKLPTVAVGAICALLVGASAWAQAVKAAPATAPASAPGTRSKVKISDPSQAIKATALRESLQGQVNGDAAKAETRRLSPQQRAQLRDALRKQPELPASAPGASQRRVCEPATPCQEKP